MSAFGRFVLPCVLSISLVAIACGDDPPTNEMQQAQGAIDAAAAAGAEEYASQELGAARESLKRAGDAVNQRDYRLALSSALDSREHAQTAAKEAADNKAAARAEAERALVEASHTIEDAREKLKSNEGAHLPARSLAAARLTIGEAENAVQEARAAVGRGEFKTVVTKLNETMKQVREIGRVPEAPPPRPGRRRR